SRQRTRTPTTASIVETDRKAGLGEGVTEVTGYDGRGRLPRPRKRILRRGGPSLDGELRLAAGRRHTSRPWYRGTRFGEDAPHAGVRATHRCGNVSARKELPVGDTWIRRRLSRGDHACVTWRNFRAVSEDRHRGRIAAGWHERSIDHKLQDQRGRWSL